MLKSNGFTLPIVSKNLKVHMNLQKSFVMRGFVNLKSQWKIFSLFLRLVLGKLNFKLYKVTVIERPKLYFHWLDQQNILSQLLGKGFV